MSFNYSHIKTMYYENLPEEVNERIDDLENIRIVATNFHSDTDAWLINPYGYGVTLPPNTSSKSFSINPQLNIGDVISSVDIWIYAVDCSNINFTLSLNEVIPNNGGYDASVLASTGILLNGTNYQKYTMAVPPHTVTEGDTYSVVGIASTEGDLDAYVTVSCAIITVQR